MLWDLIFCMDKDYHLRFKKDISHLHIHSGRMRADLRRLIYFHQKAYWISDFKGITELLVPRFLFRADVVKVKSECVSKDARQRGSLYV